MTPSTYRHRAPSSSAGRYEGVKGQPKEATQTLFDAIDEVKQQAIQRKPEEGPPVNDLLKRLARVRENLELAKRMVFDSGKYEGTLTPEQEADLDAKWEKMREWFIEYSTLIRTLFRRGIDYPEWHCKRCGTLITAALVSNESCFRCVEPPEGARTFFDLLATRGWVAIECKALDGEVICVARDEGVETSGDGVRYTLDELDSILRSSPSAEGLKAIHETKKEMKGRVIPE